MPSRKQRRRRQKERRHEYEYVYVDEEGHEIDVEPEEVDRPKHETRRNGKKAPAQTKRKQGGSGPGRKVDPPSWPRIARRAPIFGLVIFLALGLLDHKQSVESRVLLTLVYTAFLVPFMYLTDRAMYRAYLRRTGQMPAPRRPSKRA
jgi:hypothetical protein